MMNRKAWEDHEAHIANMFGGRTTAGSGNTPLRKGDVDNGEFLIECKCTEKDKFRLTFDIVVKLWNESVKENRDPLIALRIADEDYIVEYHRFKMVKVDPEDPSAITVNSSTTNFSLYSDYWNQQFDLEMMTLKEWQDGHT